MNQKPRDIASITFGLTIALAPSQQVSLGDLSRFTAIGERAKES